MRRITESNLRYGQVALAISGGRAIRNLATILTAGSAGLTLAQISGIIGTFLDTGGYSASRAVLVD